MTDMSPEEFWGDDDVAEFATSKPMTLLEHALAAAARGFYVYPAIPMSKKPMFKGPQHWATRDIQKITDYWNANPICNLSIIDDKFGDGTEKLMLLDTDKKEGKDGEASLRQLEQEYGALPRTYTEITPSGSHHRVFRVLYATRRNTSRIGPGIDTAWQILAAGSKRADGEVRVLIDAPVAAAPQWLIDLVGRRDDTQKSDAPSPDSTSDSARRRDDKPKSDKPAPDSTSDGARRRGRDFLATAAKVSETESGTDSLAYAVTGQLLDRCLYADEDAVEDMLDIWLPRNIPGITRERCEKSVRNHLKYRKSAPGCNDPQEEFTAVYYDYESDIPAPEMTPVDPATEFDCQPITLSEILKRDAKPVAFIVPKLIQKHVVNALDGPGGANKSRLAMQIGLCAAAGVAMLGGQCEQCTPVHLSSEDDIEELTRRCQAITRQLQLTPGREMIFWDRTGADSTIAEVAEGGVVTLMPFYHELRRRLLAIYGHKLLILDSLFDYIRYLGRAKIDETAVNVVFKVVLTKLCQETDTTMIAIRHPSRSGISDGTQEGWSVANTNSVRSRLSLAPKANTKDAYVLKREKANHGPSGKDWTLYYSGGALLPREAMADADQRNRAYEAVIQVAIECSANSPMTAQKNPLPWQIERIQELSGVPLGAKEIKNYLSLAVQTGKLRYQSGHGKVKAGYFGPLKPVETEVETGLKPEVETG
jgi:hypothetical protein